MVICAECGTRNPDGTEFCRQCGQFLEWHGQAAATVTTAPSNVTPPAVAPAATTPAATAPVTTTPAAGPHAVTPAADPEAVTPAAPAATPQPRQPAAATPQARRPDVARPRRPDPTPAEPEQRAPRPLICQRCGAANEESRRLCRACGQQLAETAATEAARPSWWRRYWGSMTGRRFYAAGTRRRVRVPARWWRPLAILVLLALAVVVLLPDRGLLSRAVTEIRDRTSTHVPVVPVAFRASSSAPNASAKHLTDGASNLYWAPAGSPDGAWVEVDFARPVRLLDILVTPGISPDEQPFLTQGRPQKLTVLINPDTDHPVRDVLSLRDAPGSQRFSVKANDAHRVRLTIDATYGIPPGQLCAIAEVEFFGR